MISYNTFILFFLIGVWPMTAQAADQVIQKLDVISIRNLALGASSKFIDENTRIINKHLPKKQDAICAMTVQNSDNDYNQDIANTGKQRSIKATLGKNIGPVSFKVRLNPFNFRGNSMAVNLDLIKSYELLQRSEIFEEGFSGEEMAEIVSDGIRKIVNIPTNLSNDLSRLSGRVKKELDQGIIVREDIKQISI